MSATHHIIKEIIEHHLNNIPHVPLKILVCEIINMNGKIIYHG